MFKRFRELRLPLKILIILGMIAIGGSLHVPFRTCRDAALELAHAGHIRSAED